MTTGSPEDRRHDLPMLPGTRAYRPAGRCKIGGLQTLFP